LCFPLLNSIKTNRKQQGTPETKIARRFL